MPSLRIAKHVVAPKRHKDTQRAYRQQRINILAANKKHHAQNRQGDTTQPGCQTIDPIDQIDSVRYIYHGKDRERDTYPKRHRVDAEQSAQRVKPIAGQYQ